MAPPARYVSSTFGFAVEYPLTAQPASQDSQSVQWTGNGQEGSGPWGIKLQGEMANGRTPQQLVDALQQSTFAGATVVFNITGATIGYTDAYGNIYDQIISPQGGLLRHERLLIEAAVRNGIAVELVAYSDFAPDQSFHPEPAQMVSWVEGYGDIFGNSVTWRNEPPL